MATAPTAFISHATEDKQRFVFEFAKKLRANGVEAWLDAWEIKAGDSLVGKIFEEGIKNASAFIIIILATSINKPWVREELDSGMVGKIAKTCRLMPALKL
ncbi:MAG TPA: toll/interleukin-1 receptor domain-containing protein [Verrucomicrobiae bacterium]|nr:toll/interleukin-1 receptor domain-containing protein [Verrucomicrobiae bacterium]